MSAWPTHFTARRAWFTFIRARFKIWVGDEARFHVQQAPFRLKEEMIVYSDAARTTEWLRIQARNIIDFSATYDVHDTVTGQRVGGLVRKGFRSMFRDTWTVLDAHDQPIGTVAEPGGMASLLRRLFRFLPQTYHLTLHGEAAGTFRRRFNPFQLVYDVALEGAPSDPRMGLAMSVLLMAIERRQR